MVFGVSVSVCHHLPKRKESKGQNIVHSRAQTKGVATTDRLRRRVRRTNRWNSCVVGRGVQSPHVYGTHPASIRVAGGLVLLIRRSLPKRLTSFAKSICFAMPLFSPIPETATLGRESSRTKYLPFRDTSKHWRPPLSELNQMYDTRDDKRRRTRWTGFTHAYRSN